MTCRDDVGIAWWFTKPLIVKEEALILIFKKLYNTTIT